MARWKGFENQWVVVVIFHLRFLRQFLSVLFPPLYYLSLQRVFGSLSTLGTFFQMGMCSTACPCYRGVSFYSLFFLLSAQVPQDHCVTCHCSIVASYQVAHGCAEVFILVLARRWYVIPVVWFASFCYSTAHVLGQQYVLIVYSRMGVASGAVNNGRHRANVSSSASIASGLVSYSVILIPF